MTAPLTECVCLCARWSYGRCSQAQQERMWNEDQSATGRSHLHTAVVDTDDLPYLSSWTGHRVDVHVVYLSIGLVVRWYAPVWYTGTSLVGLKSYRHFLQTDCHTGIKIIKIVASRCVSEVQNMPKTRLRPLPGGELTTLPHNP